MTIAFTGHRDFDLNSIKPSLYEQLKAIVNGGEVTFVSGMAIGFDLAAAECVITLRGEYNNIKLKCVVPFADQYKYFSNEDKARYMRVLESADEVITLESEYSQLVYHRRNNYLVESADRVVAYYDRQNKGGTAYTVKKAKKLHVEVINLYPQQQLSLF